MKRTIAIVAGGDTSEFHVSLRSAQGIYSFIDKEKYTLYIVEMHGLDWHVQLPDGAKAPVDRNDFSFVLDGEKVTFDFAYITIHVHMPSGNLSYPLIPAPSRIRCQYGLRHHLTHSHR